MTFHNIGILVSIATFLYLLSSYLLQSKFKSTKQKIVLHTAIVTLFPFNLTAKVQTAPQTLQLEVRPLRHSLETFESSMVLARAFKDDPVQSWIKPNPETRINESFHSYSLFLKATPCVHVAIDRSCSDSIKGVCMWRIPYEVPSNTERLKMAWSMLLHEGVGHLRTMVKFLSQLERTKKEIMGQQTFCYLMILGVDAPSRGQGIGKVLVRPGLEYADKQGLPCYLESSNVRNISFYESLGFEKKKVIHFDEENVKSPILTCMVRQPRGGAPITH